MSVIHYHHLIRSVWKHVTQKRGNDKILKEIAEPASTARKITSFPGKCECLLFNLRYSVINNGILDFHSHRNTLLAVEYEKQIVPILLF